MTSVSSVVGAQSFSPLSRLQDELSSEVSSGAINSSDQTALNAALTDIDSQLKSQMQSASNGQPPSPGDMQSKINNLIAGEVSSGKLTSTQADELKQVFVNAFQGGPGGPPPGGPPPGAGGAGSDSNATNSTSTSDSGVSTLLQDFLKNLEAAQGSSTGYGTDGNGLAAQIQSLIVNYQV